jgi:hypothetical protein
LRELAVAVKKSPVLSASCGAGLPDAPTHGDRFADRMIPKVVDFSDKSMLTIKVREALSDFDPNR